MWSWQAWSFVPWYPLLRALGGCLRLAPAHMGTDLSPAFPETQWYCLSLFICPLTPVNPSVGDTPGLLEVAEMRVAMWPAGH